MEPIPRSRKLVFYLLAALLSWGMLELALHLSYAVLKGQPFPLQTYQAAMHRATGTPRTIQTQAPPAAEPPRSSDAPTSVDLTDGPTARSGKSTEVIHPYLGFVLDPERATNVSILGFPEADDNPFVREPGELNIAIFGGSFAEGVGRFGEAVVVEKLAEHGLRARVLTVAMGGYKQPQQLIALAYLLSHGAQLDAVVNLDGFNEVALPEAENLTRGVNPFFPRNWYQRTLEVEDRLALRQIGKIVWMQEKRRRWATACQRLPGWSALGNTVWRAIDRVWLTRIQRENEKLRAPEISSSKSFRSVGPTLGDREGAVLYQRIADHWTSCSLQMKALCDAHDITYIHLLQPNQYLEGSKTLTPQEQRIAFRADHPYRAGVVQGYPLLVEAGKQLRRGGVDFYDLTKIFRGSSRTIYKDDCCHPNQEGYRIVGRKVASILVRHLEAEAVPESGAPNNPR